MPPGDKVALHVLPGETGPRLKAAVVGDVAAKDPGRAAELLG